MLLLSNCDFRKLLDGVVAAHANAASQMLEGRVELGAFLRAVEKLCAAERSLTETCFGTHLGVRVCS